MMKITKATEIDLIRAQAALRGMRRQRKQEQQGMDAMRARRQKAKDYEDARRAATTTTRKTSIATKTRLLTNNLPTAAPTQLNSTIRPSEHLPSEKQQIAMRCHDLKLQREKMEYKEHHHDFCWISGSQQRNMKLWPIPETNQESDSDDDDDDENTPALTNRNTVTYQQPAVKPPASATIKMEHKLKSCLKSSNRKENLRRWRDPNRKVHFPEKIIVHVYDEDNTSFDSYSTKDRYNRFLRCYCK